MGKYTPGPWKLLQNEPQSNSPLYLYSANHDPRASAIGREQHIAEVDLVGHGKQFLDEQTANALLIAAAPEMLDELMRTVKVIEALYVDGVPDQVRLIAQRSLALIAKATGGGK